MDKAQLSELLSTQQARLDAVRNSWPVLGSLFGEMRAEAVESLVAQESEQVRGRIKELDLVMELPSSLSAEVEQLAQAMKDLPD